MEYRDYNAEMLKLYFKEKNYSKWEKNRLLETNPFDNNYLIWEKQTINNNKTFAIILKKKKLIDDNIPIQEITIHPDNNVGSYLHNNVSYTICSINENINKLKLQNKLILIKGFYPHEEEFLKKVQHYNIPFITGICTKQVEYYLYILNEYKKMLEQLKDCELITEKNNEQNILILKTKNKK